MKRVNSTCIKTSAGNRQFVCNNKFEAIAEQNHDQETKQDGNIVRFDCGVRGEKQVGSENGSEVTGGCKKDPNIVGISLSSSVESEPLCEIVGG